MTSAKKATRYGRQKIIKLWTILQVSHSRVNPKVAG
jgi:hypothetical protein